LDREDRNQMTGSFHRCALYRKIDRKWLKDSHSQRHIVTIIWSVCDPSKLRRVVLWQSLIEPKAM